MRLLSAVGCVLVLAMLAPAATPEQVQEAIRKGKEFLYSKQNNAGHWELANAPDPRANEWSPAGGQYTGLTALVVLAQRCSADEKDRRRCMPAKNFLVQTPTDGTYALAIRCAMWARPPWDPQDANAIGADTKKLLSTGNRDGMHRITTRANSPLDLGASAMSVWGLQAINSRVETPDGYWAAVGRCWHVRQNGDGGWRVGEGAHPGMTAGGLMSLLLIERVLWAMQGLNCIGNLDDAEVHRALGRIAQDFPNTLESQFPCPFSNFSVLALEQALLAGGRRSVGEADWFAHGADWLIKQQHGDGSWRLTDAQHSLNGVADTAVAVMFLAEGSLPVAVTKLEYREVAPGRPRWNQRPHDVANLVEHLGRAMCEMKFRWQVLSLEAPVEVMLEGPILAVCGRGRPDFDANERAKLRSYIEGGGLVFGNADCAAQMFANAFQKLGTDLYPDYRFRELPPDHPIYTRQMVKRVLWRHPPSVLGLSNGVRELMILVPKDDPAKCWQTKTYKGREELFDLMADVYSYAVHQQFRGIWQEPRRAVPKVDAKIERQVRVTRIRHGGNWDPEPGAWRRQEAEMRSSFGAAIQVEPIEPGGGGLDGRFDVAHLTGTGQLNLPGLARAELTRYVLNGGLLMIDAAGGGREFGESAEAELLAMFPRAKIEALPAEHPVYSWPYQIDGKTTRYRPFTRQFFMSNGPRLKSVVIDGRVGVIFSPEDLTAGMADVVTDGIVGYEPKTAQAIVTNVLLHRFRPVPATAPVEAGK